MYNVIDFLHSTTTVRIEYILNKGTHPHMVQLYISKYKERV